MPLPPTPILVGVWIIVSNLFNLSSKHISSQPGANWIWTTMMQLAFASMFGMALTWIRKPRLRWRAYVSSGLVMQTVPVGVALAVANGAMMFALSRTSISVFQTVKASSPLFTSIACHTCLNRRYTIETYVTLLPILFGLLLATLSDIRGDVWGVMACMVSSLAQVYINLSIKALYDGEWALDDVTDEDTTTRKVDALEMQFLISVMGFISSFYMFLCIFLINSYGGGMFSIPQVNIFSLDALAILVNVVLYSSENMAAYVNNASMSRLPFAVSDAIRRLSIVLVSNIVASLVPTGMNVVGILCVAAGSVRFAKIVKEIEPSSLGTV